MIGYAWPIDRLTQEGAIFETEVLAHGRWWSQLIPIYNLIGLARTAKRINAAHVAVGSPTRVSVFVSWFWAPAWYASRTRYLQRRVNVLHDVLAAIPAK
jgi:photosystem II stability/assembly factor-like uncharacterized protein